MQQHRVTAVVGVTKTGIKLPIMFIVKASSEEHLIKSLRKLNLNTIFVGDYNGWMNTKTFKYQFKKVAVPVCKGKKFVIVLDNLSCHRNDEYKNIILNNEGHASFLPPYSTSIGQPLNVGVFGPLKQVISRLHIEDKTEYHSISEKKPTR